MGCLFLVLLMLAISLFAVVGTLGSMGAGVEPSDRNAEIALIRVEGVITAGSSTTGLFGGAIGSDEVVRQIERAVKNDRIKAIVLRVNSPGGSAAGSQEIYHAVRRARKKGKVVVVSMADVAASGGYYIAAGADKIYADPATMTGSIGVIAMHEDISGLFDKLGIRTETLKSGKLKDMFSPYGPLTEEARAVMRAMLMQIYEQFVRAVAEGRDMTVAEVKALADGRLYTGAQAVENGLVDELGGLRDALEGAAKLSGAKSSAYVEFGGLSLLRMLLGAESRSREVRAAVPGGILYDRLAAQLVWGERVNTLVGSEER